MIQKQGGYGGMICNICSERAFMSGYEIITCVRYAFGDASYSETVNSMVKYRFGAAA